VGIAEIYHIDPTTIAQRWNWPQFFSVLLALGKKKKTPERKRRGVDSLLQKGESRETINYADWLEQRGVL